MVRLAWKRDVDSEQDRSVSAITGDEPVIPYIDAFNRVGQVRFGDVWGLSLTDDHRRDLEAGLWQASSASAYLSAQEKAKAIEWRRSWVDTWLAESGLIDPIRRQHDQEIPPIPRKNFEAAFFPVFGGLSGSDVELDLRGELERSYEDQIAYAKALQVLATPWSPPECLTLDQVKTVLGDEPRPFLTNVVDLLAFGTPLPEKTRQLLGLLFRQKGHDSMTETCNALAAEGYPAEKVAAERRRAAGALFEAARRTETPVFVGSSDRHNDQPIPPHYFDVRRNLGFEDHSIATDLATLVDDPHWHKQFDAESENKPTPWLNVRVDGRWLVNWLASQLEQVGAGGEYIEPYMLEPMLGEENAGYVPLCVALHWIMTSRGTQLKRLDDEDAWRSAVAELRPTLTVKSFEVIGLPGTGGLPEVIPNSAFALIDMPSPLHGGGFLLSSPSSIDCSPYLGEEDWKKYFNDKLYVTGKQGPVWTHLQVRKADILSRWPGILGEAPPPVAESSQQDRSGAAPKVAGANVKNWLISLMKQSPTVRRSKDELFGEARERFGADISRRSFDKTYTDAIDQVPGCKWNAQGRTPARNSRT